MEWVTSRFALPPPIAGLSCQCSVCANISYCVIFITYITLVRTVCNVQVLLCSFPFSTGLMLRHFAMPVSHQLYPSKFLCPFHSQLLVNNYVIKLFYYNLQCTLHYYTSIYTDRRKPPLAIGFLSFCVLLMCLFASILCLCVFSVESLVEFSKFVEPIDSSI